MNLPQVLPPEEQERLLWVYHRAKRLRKEHPRGEALWQGERPATLEERRVAQALAEGREAFQTLVLHNLLLVNEIALRYSHMLSGRRGLSYEDLFHEGVLGLMEALDSFDPKLGHKLSTWAFHRVRYAVQRALYRSGRVASREALSLDAPLLEEEDGDTLGDFVESPLPGPAEAYERKEEGERIARALRQELPEVAELLLSGWEADVVRLSQLLGEEPKNLRTRLRQALQG